MGKILRKLEKIRSGLTPKRLGTGALCILLLAVIVYSGSLIYHSGFFKVTRISSNVPIEPALKNYIFHKSLFKLDIKKIYAFLYGRHPEYKSIQVVKEFPSLLRINVIQRKPFAQLYLKNFYILDREGVVIGVSESSNSPQMVIIEMGQADTSLPKGMRITDKRLELAFKLIEVIKTRKFLNKFSIKSINVAFPESTFFLANDTRIVIGNNDFERKLYILENLLNEKLAGSMDPIEYIDLRYKKGYVGYKK
jgi:cell division septal protein FtsQ